MTRQPHRGILITVSGVDGSGKTTLCNYLADGIRARNKNVVVHYGRYRPILLTWIFRSWMRIGSKPTMNSDYHKYHQSRSTALSNRFLFSLYKAALIKEYQLSTLLRVRRDLKRGRTVICDRYIYDTIVMDLELSRSPPDEELRSLIYEFRKSFPVPDISIMLTTDESTAYKRKTDIPDYAYSTESASLYRRITSLHSFNVIDGSQPTDRVAVEAMELVERALQTEGERQ